MSENNPFEIAQRQLDECARILNLDENVKSILRSQCVRYIMSIPVRMDNGKTRVFQDSGAVL